MQRITIVPRDQISTLRLTHCASIMQTNQLILFNEIIIVSMGIKWDAQIAHMGNVE
jgi:hypothetical protein